MPGTSAPLLPLKAATTDKIVIVGDLAGTVTLGDYSGDPSLQVNAVQGISAAVKAANPGAQVLYDACATSTKATAPAACSAQTMADVASADAVVVFVGTDTNLATEGTDRTTIAMPGDYDSLIDQVAAVGNPRMLLAIQSAGPVTLDNEQGKFPAVALHRLQRREPGHRAGRRPVRQAEPGRAPGLHLVRRRRAAARHEQLRPDARADRRPGAHLPVLHRRPDLPVRLRP